MEIMCFHFSIEVTEKQVFFLQLLFSNPRNLGHLERGRAIRLEGSRVLQLPCGRNLCTKEEFPRVVILMRNFSCVKLMEDLGFVKQLVLP